MRSVAPKKQSKQPNEMPNAPKKNRQIKLDEANAAFTKAQKERDKLLAGTDNADLRDARATLEIAEAELASAMADTLSSEKKTVDAAKRAFEKAKQAVADGATDCDAGRHSCLNGDF
jgi:multidrug efflux pump subunit AcrA (membrane-fusion protein)